MGLALRHWMAPRPSAGRAELHMPLALLRLMKPLLRTSCTCTMQIHTIQGALRLPCCLRLSARPIPVPQAAASWRWSSRRSTAASWADCRATSPPAR